MNKFAAYWRAHHPIVHLIMLGAVLISLTNSMSVVFLPIYLISFSELDPVMVGTIVGLGALTATFGGFIGGTLSDFIGRQRLLVISLLVLCFVFLGFLYFNNPIFLCILNIFRGLFSSFFNIISKAIMADLTPEERRFRVFSNRYLAGNIGFSIGPILGTIFGFAGNSIAFIFSAVIYFIYFLFMILTIKFSMSKENPKEKEESFSPIQAWQVFRKDKALLLFILGSVLLTTVHGEMSVTLSQYLEGSMTDGIKLFGYLMSINGITVITTQVFMTRWAERFGLFQRIIMGSLLFAVGEIGFAFSHHNGAFILSMIIFTLGEILIIPSEYAQIDEITPKGMRGMYYGAQGFSEIGNFIGPWFGGVLLVSHGGKVMFLTMALFSLVSIAFYGWGRKQNKKAPYIPISIKMQL
ncbi:MDR family MFS transporter [Neobacillus sp. D3-1R]|uniref:MDR family MFS transporter n=1 Tax=Neobacillus sp. D3-1R TaxID=3445778 RepID=UPI003FA09209